MSHGKCPISFEFFPPKSAAGQDNLIDTAKQLADFSPHFFSMTYGAGGSTRETTIQMIRLLQAQLNAPLAPHLSCIGSTRAELIELITLFKSLGLTRIVALRGDLPSGMGRAGELMHANELVTLIRDVTGDHFYIEVAAYPEYHPQAKNARLDLKYFKQKVDAGANSAITQYFYNPDAYFYFLDECAHQHIYIPIIPGIMPITNASKLIQFSERCGAEIPRWLFKKLETYGDDIESIKQFGHEVVFNLCDQLIKGGAPGLHFYTLNQAEATSNVIDELDASTTNPFRLVAVNER
jgi:methylenetetrahydrofolate reductase (NADPH)